MIVQLQIDPEYYRANCSKNELIEFLVNRDTQLISLRAQLTAMTAERDDYKKSYEDLRDHYTPESLRGKLTASEARVKQLQEALKVLMTDTETVARDSFATSSETWEEDWKTEEPTGYAVWKQAQQALTPQAPQQEEE